MSRLSNAGWTRCMNSKALVRLQNSNENKISGHPQASPAAPNVCLLKAKAILALNSRWGKQSNFFPNGSNIHFHTLVMDWTTLECVQTWVYSNLNWADQNSSNKILIVIIILHSSVLHIKCSMPLSRKRFWELSLKHMNGLNTASRK